MVIYQQSPIFVKFANDILGVNFGDEVRTIASVSRDATILGVVVYSRWSVHNCEMSVASISPKFLTKELLKAAFDYPFNFCKKSRTTSVIEENNTKALKLNRGLGFIDEGVLRDWYGEGRNGIVLGLLKRDCKWLNI